MTDYVGADPGRLGRLARLLGVSAEVIKANEPGIRNNIKAWHQSVDTSALTNLAAWLAEQQGPMNDRAAAALTALHQPAFRVTARASTHSKLPVEIAFDITPEGLALQGRLDAANWSKRLASKENQNQLADDMTFALETHADDPAYLQAFFANGGAKVLAQMPRYEQSLKHLPLTDLSKHRLATYGKAIANASNYQERGIIQLPSDAWKPITQPENGDMWSSGALVHYVPKDHIFGPTFLHELATSALAWRKSHQPPRPPYVAAQTGTLWSIGKYVEDDNAWWKDLGLSVNQTTTERKDVDADIEQIRDQDPVLAILAKTGANPEASRRLLTGPLGFEHARQLVDVHWQSPSPNGPIDESAGPAAIIVAATSDRGPTNGEKSAQAALNLINAANDEHHEKRDDFDREQYPGISPTQAAALSFVASRYLDDLTSALRRTNDTNVVILGTGGTYKIATNSTDINGFLHLLAADPKAAGAFEAAIRASLTMAAQTVAQSADPSDLLTPLGQMLGTLTLVQRDLEYDEAAKKDAAAERHRIYFGLMSGIIEAVPTGRTAVEVAQILAAATGGTFTELLFPTDEIEKSAGAAERATFQAINSMREEVAQGLLQAGKVPPPPKNASFVHNGVILPRTAEEDAMFTEWWNTLPARLTDLEDDAMNGFGRATNQASRTAARHDG